MISKFSHDFMRPTRGGQEQENGWLFALYIFWEILTVFLVKNTWKWYLLCKNGRAAFTITHLVDF